MSTRKALLGIVISATLLTLSFSIASAVKVAVVNGAISGTVFQTLASGKTVGVPGMQIRLVPARATGRSPIVTITNSQGAFDFGTQPKEAYMFEVRRGVALLYRRIIDTHHDSELSISLRRKA